MPAKIIHRLENLLKHTLPAALVGLFLPSFYRNSGGYIPDLRQSAGGLIVDQGGVGVHEEIVVAVFMEQVEDILIAALVHQRLSAGDNRKIRAPLIMLVPQHLAEGLIIEGVGIRCRTGSIAAGTVQIAAFSRAYGYKGRRVDPVRFTKRLHPVLFTCKHITNKTLEHLLANLWREAILFDRTIDRVQQILHSPAAHHLNLFRYSVAVFFDKFLIQYPLAFANQIVAGRSELNKLIQNLY